MASGYNDARVVQGTGGGVGAARGISYRLPHSHQHSQSVALGPRDRSLSYNCRPTGDRPARRSGSVRRPAVVPYPYALVWFLSASALPGPAERGSFSACCTRYTTSCFNAVICEAAEIRLATTLLFYVCILCISVFVYFMYFVSLCLYGPSCLK